MHSRPCLASTLLLLDPGEALAAPRLPLQAGSKVTSARIDEKPETNFVHRMIELAINDDRFTLIDLTLRRRPEMGTAN